MAPPTTLTIKTSAVMRMIKEEAMYHKERVVEQQRLEKMQADPESDEYAVAQQKKVVEETKSVVPSVREKLRSAIEGLQAEFQLQGASGAEPASNKEAASKAIADGTSVLASDVA